MKVRAICYSIGQRRVFFLAPRSSQLEATFVQEGHTVVVLQDKGEHLMKRKIAEIKGMTDGTQAKLAEKDITHNEHLLEHHRDPHKRNELLKHLGVQSAQLTEWVNRADLMRLKGVGREMSNLLEECGVDSCKELQHRTPDNLYKKLKETNDAQHITHHAPTLALVKEWVKEAAKFAAES
jgi:predicted flap endonuclease-1-like 5' DNA nuclease